MTEIQGNTEKMDKRKTQSKLLVFTGGAALLAVAVNLAIVAICKRKKKKELPGFELRVNLSASEILNLADKIIAKSKKVHDAVASVPPNKVTYSNVISPLADLEAEQFPLVQSCVFPKLISTSDDVRIASAEAERRIDAHVQMCSKREDVYRVVKAFSTRGEQTSAEQKCFIQCL